MCKRKSLLGMALVAAAASVIAGASVPLPLAAQSRPAQPAQQQSPKVVFLVRHAEKEAVAGNDQPLSAQGKARARDLARALQHTAVSAVVLTQWQRTGQTAAEFLSVRAVPVVTVPTVSGAVQIYVDSAVRVIERSRGDVLVVGHSNTIPALIAGLGGGAIQPICDDTYSNLFVLYLDERGHAARVVQLHYGAADPAGSGQCPAPK